MFGIKDLDLNIDLVSVFSSNDFHFTNDIGDYIGKNINNYSKRELLINQWVAPTNYIFPFSEHNKNSKLVSRFIGLQQSAAFK